jgi:hypothetical protein
LEYTGIGKSSMNGKYWTPAEDAILHEIWHADGALHEHMHRLPGRKPDGACLRAKRIGLGARYIAWTAEEDSILREIWMRGSVKSQLSRLPGRSWKGVLTRAEKLRLPKRSASIFVGGGSWVDDAVHRILKSGLPMNAHILAGEIGASYSRTSRILNQDRNDHFRIVGWEHVSASNIGAWTPIWSIGSEPDVPMPKKSSTERMRITRAKQRMNAASFNPFATAMGVVEIKSTIQGRIFTQPMDVEQWHQSRGAA